MPKAASTTANAIATTTSAVPIVQRSETGGRTGGDGAGGGAADTASTFGSEGFAWRGFRFAAEASPVLRVSVRFGFGGIRHVFDSGGPFP
jgi:hypothetical protein